MTFHVKLLPTLVRTEGTAVPGMFHTLEPLVVCQVSLLLVTSPTLLTEMSMGICGLRELSLEEMGCRYFAGMELAGLYASAGFEGKP